jgi:hypothetical protein
MTVVAAVVGLFIISVAVVGLLVSCLVTCASVPENGLTTLKVSQFSA